MRGDLARRGLNLGHVLACLADVGGEFLHAFVEAAEILELFTREIAPHYYNRAIFDVQAHLKERFESIESDLWALEKN